MEVNTQGVLLDKYKFPVVERAVGVPTADKLPAIWEDENSFLHNGYKAIVREDTDELISIVKKSYELVTNTQLIDNLLGNLEDLETPTEIDKSHSFVNNKAMRLQIKFPELTMPDEDGTNEIALSLFVHNSYDMSEGVRMMWGAIKQVCTNGMVIGKILGRMYHKHTSGFQLEKFREGLTKTYEKFPQVAERIEQLQEAKVTEEFLKKLEATNVVGKRIMKTLREDSEVNKGKDINQVSQYQLMNMITWVISHRIRQEYRARYQSNISNVFGL